MRRRVFFSFDYNRDLWRANQIHNVNVIAEPDVAGFFHSSELEPAKIQGKDAIQRLILKHLDSTSVTLVLIGLQTADHLWVKYEIEQSIALKNGLLGIRIHHLNDKDGKTSSPGPTPSVPAGVKFPIYDWDGNLHRFTKEIEDAGKRADALRI